MRLVRAGLSTAVIAMVLTACGGGGGGTTASTSPAALGGTLEGLASGRQLTLFNGSDSVTLSSNGPFTFPAGLGNSASYSVNSRGLPQGQVCAINNGTGVNETASVNVIHVYCAMQYAYVTNYQDNTISQYIVNADGSLSAQSTATQPTGQGPADVVIDPSARHAYVVNRAGSTISQYTIGTDGSLSAMSPATVSAGSAPFAIAIDVFRRWAYAVNAGDNTISEYLIGSGGQLMPLATPTIATGGQPVALAFNPVSDDLYVIAYNDSKIYRYSLQGDGTLLANGTISTGQGPNSISVDPSGMYVYVPCNDNQVYQYLVTSSGALQAMATPSQSAGAGPINSVIAPSGRFVYVNNLSDGTVSEFSVTATGALTPLPAPNQTIAIGHYPWQMRMDASGQFLYTINNDNTVTQLGVGAGGALTVQSTTAAGHGAGYMALRSTPKGPTLGTKISQPTPVNVFTSAGDLAIPVKAIGSQVLPSFSAMIFDTGSAGAVMQAQAVFPASLVSTSGFVFPANQNYLVYNNIRVSGLQVAKKFGPASNPSLQTIMTGNMGYATMTVGAAGEVQTQRVPILFYYSVTDGNGNARPPQNIGIFGVNSAAGAVFDLANDPAPPTLDVCNEFSTSTCYQTSILNSITFDSGVIAGMALTPLSANPGCSMATGGGCTMTPYLTLGLTPTIESGFGTVVSLACPGVQPTGLGNYGIVACDPGINAIINVGGYTYSALTLFDSGGNDGMLIIPSAISAHFPSGVPSGTGVQVSYGTNLLGSFSTTATGPLITLNASGRNVVGFPYFLGHSFFIDLTNYQVGFQ